MYNYVVELTEKRSGDVTLIKLVSNHRFLDSKISSPLYADYFAGERLNFGDEHYYSKNDHYLEVYSLDAWGNTNPVALEYN